MESYKREEVFENEGDKCSAGGLHVASNCSENPETLLGFPIGMYHCPECGSMQLAEIPHLKTCIKCGDYLL